jgi:polo-like kinase 1
MDEGKSVDNKDNQAESGIIEEKITQANGEIKIKKYSKGKALGRGGFAKCYEVTNLENKKVLAAKIIAKNSLSRSRAKQKVTDLFYFS